MTDYSTLIMSGVSQTKNIALKKLIYKSIRLINPSLGTDQTTIPKTGRWCEFAFKEATQIKNLIVTNQSSDHVLWIWDDLFDSHNIIGEIFIPSSAKSNDDIIVTISSLTFINETDIQILTDKINLIYH